MPRKKTPAKTKTKSSWTVLATLIAEYGEACRDDEAKYGGDPLSIPEIEAQLTLARAKIEVHLAHMQQQEIES